MSTPQSMTIRSQDDYELFRHIETSWSSIQATVRELNRRKRTVVLMHKRNAYHEFFDDMLEDFQFQMPEE